MVTRQVRRLAESFGAAWRGIKQCARCERNFRIHLVAAAYALSLGFTAGFDAADFALLLVNIALVLGGEMLNTAIELCCDLFGPGYNRLVRLAKDAAAGAVLVFSITAAACGAVMFTRSRSLGALIAAFSDKPWLAGIFALGLAPSLLFIFFGGKKNNGHK